MATEKDNFHRLKVTLDTERIRSREAIDRDNDTILDLRTALEVLHSALKLEKNCNFKSAKNIICIFKNGKKSIFAPEKSLKIAFLVVLNFFLVQKWIFYHF